MKKTLFRALFGTRRRKCVTGAALLLLCALLALAVWIAMPCKGPLEGVSFSVLCTDREGAPLRLGLSKDGRYRLKIRLGDIPQDAIASVLRYEDRSFWYHPGVNPLALMRSGFAMLTGGRRMGGSTLTMQIVRLRLGLRTGSVRDKLLQIVWALRLEAHHSKEEILEAYFNLAPYGGNVEGLGAASLIYFHKEASRLTQAEMLSLIPVPQNPAVRMPSPENTAFLEAAARLQALVEKDTTPAMPAGAARLRVHTFRELPFRAPHLVSEILGREENGATIRTTIDPRLQIMLEAQLGTACKRRASEGLNNGAAMIVHWPSREVVALAGSADFFDKGISGQIDGTNVRRSPGSTLKPFIYGLALDQGLIHPKTLVIDMPKSFSGYDPENFDGTFQGPLPADRALRLSRNVPAISLANQLKSPGLYGFLKQAGVRFDFSEEHYGLSLVLGGAEVTMRELATLYTMLANGGTWKPLIYNFPDRRAPGEAQEPHEAQEARQLLSPEASYLVTDMLKTDDLDGTVRCAGGLRLPLRYKTGTSNGLRDAWTIGFVGPYVLCVWLGNFDNTSNPMLVGAQAALPLFRDISRALAARFVRSDPLAEPSPTLKIRRLPVCSATGDVDITLCPDPLKQATAWFIPGVSPVKDTGILRRVLINKRTGYRSCTPGDGESELRVVEFWPTEFTGLYERAGIVLPKVPPLAEGCPKEYDNQSKGPRIMQPKKGITYYARSGENTCRLVLQAHGDAGISTVYWFIGNELIGSAKPGEPLVHRILPGDYTVRCVDDRQQSTSLPLHVRRTP